MENQSESNIHFETRNGVWIIEQEKGTGNFQLARPGPWDEYDVSRSYPILYWGQTKNFIQLAKNIWDNGFKFLVNPVEGFGPKRRLKFEFRSPYIPKNTLITCYIAYNGTGIVYRFPDPLNPTDFRQLVISGADDRYPDGSVKFSLFHTNNNSGGLMRWNSGLGRNNNNGSNNNNNNNVVLGTEEEYTYYWMKPASKINSKKRKRKSDQVELCYPLDFRLDSKFFTKEYPLIIRPLNRFCDFRSYYMAELAEKCIFHQGIEHVEEFRNEASAKAEKLKEIFLYYPNLLRFCLWYYTPKEYKGFKNKHFHRNRSKNDKNYLNNILASIAQYVPPNSPFLSNFPKLKLTQQPTTEYQQVNMIQQWINKVYNQSEHHCLQCESWYSTHSEIPENSFTLLSTSETKKYNYKNNESVMKIIESENHRKQKESIKSLKGKFEGLPRIKQKKKIKRPSMSNNNKSNSNVTSDPNNENSYPPSNPSGNRQSQQPSSGRGLFSRLFKASSPSPSPTPSYMTNSSSSTNKVKLINNNNRYESDDWVDIEDQSYPAHAIANRSMNNYGLDGDSSMEKGYDNSFNYDFNMDNLTQIPNTQQQLQNILQDSDLLSAESSQDKLGNGYDDVNDVNSSRLYGGRMEERERHLIEYTRESALMNFGLNIANMVSASASSDYMNGIGNNPGDRNGSKNKKKKNSSKNVREPAIVDGATEINNIISEAEQEKEQQQLQQQLQLQAEQQNRQKKTEQKIHCCLSTTYYHIPPNSVINECSSEACYFENREQLAKQLANRLTYYLIGYRWIKRGVQLGFLVGLYFMSRKLWQSDDLWEWIKDECQDRMILLVLKGQDQWISYLIKNKITQTEGQDYEETLKTIRRKEKRLQALRLQQQQSKSEGISEEDRMQLRIKKRGMTTITGEIKELFGMFLLRNSSEILESYKQNLISWYNNNLKNPLTNIKSWDDFLKQMKLLLAALKVHFFNLFNLIKAKVMSTKTKWDPKYSNPQYIMKIIKSLYIIKWCNEKYIFLKTIIQLSLNRPPAQKS